MAPKDNDAIKGHKVDRLVVRDGMMVSGHRTPPEGPVDIAIEGGRITGVFRVDPVSLSRYPQDWKRPEGDHVIDARGMYVLPGLVDTHAHIPVDPRRAGPKGWEYAYKLWLGHGVTALRTCGWGREEVLFEQRAESMADPELPVPRLAILYGYPRDRTLAPSEARDFTRRACDAGADGIKWAFCDNIKVLEAICDETKKLGMRAGVAVHLALELGIDARAASNAGVTTIEHTYGIPEASLPGSQNYPPHYNEMDELSRFRQSAYNWSEAVQYPERVLATLDSMIENGTVWNPTMVAYEANRDLGRARTLAWNEEYANPTMRKYWTPAPGVHASFHTDWTTRDEIGWKTKFRIWMEHLKVFSDRGGTITVGTDAGSLYALYGFSSIRELELLQEAGFHPVDIIKMGTVDSARVLGLVPDDAAAGIRVGAAADLAIVDGNPLENFKVMYGNGVTRYAPDGSGPVISGGVRWTVRDGVVFDAKALMQDVKEQVKRAKGTQ